MSNKIALSDVYTVAWRYVRKPREICRNAGIYEIPTCATRVCVIVRLATCVYETGSAEVFETGVAVRPFGQSDGLSRRAEHATAVPKCVVSTREAMFLVLCAIAPRPVHRLPVIRVNGLINWVFPSGRSPTANVVNQ